MPVKIFFCYAREDEALLDKLKSHLWPLQQQKLIDILYGHNISAGAERDQETEDLINTAHIILPLVSQYSLDSDYFHSTEMQRAIERHEDGEARVVPIILRPVYYQRTPLAKLQALPSGAKPVVAWSDLNQAFADVADGIRIVASELLIQINRVQWLSEINDLYWARRYTEALTACEKILALTTKSGNVEVWHKKGLILRALKRQEEALAVLDHVLTLDFTNAEVWYDRGTVLRALERYPEAVNAFEHAEQLAPGTTDARYNKEITLQALKSSDSLFKPLIKAPDHDSKHQESQEKNLASTTVVFATDENFAEMVLNSSQVVIVLFWASWAGPARAANQVFEAVSKEYHGRAIFAKLDTDENQNVPDQWHIQAVPTLVFFKSGQEVNRIIGTIKPDELRYQVERFLITSGTFGLNHNSEV